MLINRSNFFVRIIPTYKQLTSRKVNFFHKGQNRLVQQENLINYTEQTNTAYKNSIFLKGFDYYGTLAWAMNGSSIAMAANFDVYGSMVVGIITATGGGSIRDILMGQKPVFWMKESQYLLIAIFGALLCYFFKGKMQNFVDKHNINCDNFLESLEYFCISSFCIIGAQNGINQKFKIPVVIACGLITTVGGGIMRDLIVKRPVVVFTSNLCSNTSGGLAGASSYALLYQTSLPWHMKLSISVTASILAKYSFAKK